MTIEGQKTPTEYLASPERPLYGKTVVITGTSRGVGASAAIKFAEAGANIVGTHLNPGQKRQDLQTAVLEQCRQANPNGQFEVVVGDITDPEHRLNLLESAVGGLPDAKRKVDVLVLNAAGGLERGKDSEYARKINVEANMELADLFSPHMEEGSIIIYTQSLWGHLYGQVPQEPRYEPIAKSKFKAEQELLKRIDELGVRGIRVGILVGDVIKDNAMYDLLERVDKERLEREQKLVPGGVYPSPADMGQRMVLMTQSIGQTGIIEYVGRTADQYLEQLSRGEITPKHKIIFLVRPFDFF